VGIHRRVAMGKSKKNAKKKGSRVANPMSEPLSPMSPMENPLIEVERVQEVDSSDDDEVQSRARDREAAKPRSHPCPPVLTRPSRLARHLAVCQGPTSWGRADRGRH